MTEGMTLHSRYDAHRLAHWVFSEARLCMGENERRGSHNPKCVELEGEMLFVLQRAFGAGRSSTEAVRREARAEAFAECLRELHRCGTHADVVDAITRLAAETPPKGGRP